MHQFITIPGGHDAAFVIRLAVNTNRFRGRKLLDKLVEKAREVNARRLTWQVLDWNEPAINFYKKVGASLDAEWVNCTLTREQIEGWTPKSTEKHQG
jgi:RimJ/RimL family protein N-acetyltransferase